MRFFIFILIVFSSNSFADTFTYYDNSFNALEGCKANQRRINGHDCFRVSGAGLTYYYTYIGNYNGATFFKHLARYPSGCAFYNQVAGPNGVCQEEDAGPVYCSNDTSPDPPNCVCERDGFPKNTGQYPNCDRPILADCDSLGFPVPVNNCPINPDPIETDDNNCPVDTNLVNGQCINKCAKNSRWNAYDNKCELNPPKNQCESGYTLVGDACIANACPKRMTRNSDNACVVNQEPNVVVTKETIVNEDGSTTEITTTTTSVNTGEHTTETTTTVSTIERDADGNVTSVDATETTEVESDEPEEGDRTASGSGTCDAQPSCDGDAINCAILHEVWRSGCLEKDDVVSNEVSCDQEFSCEGSVLECASLKIANKRFCEFTKKKADDFFASSEYSTHFNSGRDLDSDGVLKSLGPSEVSIKDSVNINSILSVGGKAGSCPSPIDFNIYGESGSFDYSPICQSAELSRPVFLFFVGLFCVGLISRALYKG